MRSKQSNIFSNKFRSMSNNFFVKYYKIIIILALISLFAILTAIFTVTKYSSKLELGNMTNKTLASFIKNDVSVWGLFFKKFFNYLVLCIVAIFFNIKPFCAIFNIVALSCFCYSSVFDITIFILLYGMSGIIFGVSIMIPFFIMLLFLYILISSVAIKNCILKKKFGKICAYDISNVRLYFIFVFLAFILLLIECNLLSIIHYTIIVN